MEFNRERVQANVRQATTDDLLDRVTVFSDGMEPEALDLIEDELRRRGVTRQDMEDHARRYQDRTRLPPGGVPRRCSFCPKPAVERRWEWHRIWGLLPVFPRPFYRCADHARR